MSLYADYLKEREGVDTLEWTNSFATYIMRDTDCYIIDIYVAPGSRKSGIASQMADAIAALAKLQGYRILTGSVDSRANGAEASRKVLVAYGFKPGLQQGSMTYYHKEI